VHVTLGVRFAKVVDVVTVPPLAIGKVPVTPVVNGSPVQLVNTPLVGVPSKGVTNVGLVLNTFKPVPVSSVKAAAKLAEEGVPKNVATPVPSEVIPVPPEAGNNALVKDTTWAVLIAIAVVPLVWIAIAPVVSVVIFSAVAVVVPAFIVVAILGSRCRS
jgi:hypothetical protein